MKNSTKIILTFLSALLLTATACHKVETEGVTRITYLPTIELQGSDVVYVKVGEEYADSGVVALEGDNDISTTGVTTSIVPIQGDITTTGGSYSKIYTARNVDGFTASTSRLFIVYAGSGLNNTNIEGTYNSNVLRNGDPIAADVIVNDPPYTIEVEQAYEGVYYVSDLLGGWYNTGRDYGPAYAGEGIIQVKSDNSVEIIWSSIAGWGSYVQLTGNPSTYDPDTHTLYLSVKMSDSNDFVFESTMILQ